MHAAVGADDEDPSRERERRQKRRINIYRKTAEQREGEKKDEKGIFFFTYALSRHRRPHPRALVILGRVNADLCCGALTQLFDGSSLAFALRFLLGNADAGVVGNRARRPTVQRRDAIHPKQSLSRCPTRRRRASVEATGRWRFSASDRHKKATWRSA